MLLYLELGFNEMAREVWGSKSNIQMWNTVKPNAAKIKATAAAMH